MRRAAKVDSNQSEVVAGIRKHGVSVALTHMVGRGFPDVVCGYQGATYLFEIKDGSKPPSARKLTGDEPKWHAEWQGHAKVILCADDALKEMGITPVSELQHSTLDTCCAS